MIRQLFSHNVLRFGCAILLFFAFACVNAQDTQPINLKFVSSLCPSDSNGNLVFFRNSTNVFEINLPSNELIIDEIKTPDGILQRANNADLRMIFQPMNADKATFTINVKSVKRVKTKIKETVPVSFKVIEPPMPSIIIKINGNVVENLSKIQKGDKVNLSILPNASFANNFPRDADYRFNILEIYMRAEENEDPRKIGGADVRGKTATGNGIDIPMPLDALRNIKKGTYIEVHWDTIVRSTATGALLDILNSGGTIRLYPTQ